MKSHLRLVWPALLALLPGLHGTSAQTLIFQKSAIQIASSEQIETKFILEDGQDDLARQQLKLKASKAMQEQVYFYDTKNLQLYQRGLIIRVRTPAGKSKGDITVKVMPATYSDVAIQQNTKGYKCEIDAVGSKQTSACSLTVKKANSILEEAIANKSSVQNLLTPSQQQIAQQHMAQQAVPFNWNELIAWGPNKALVWKKKAGELPFAFTVEQWTLNTGQTVTEVSARSPQTQATQNANALKSYLLGHGLKLSSKQESKTALSLRE